MAGLQGAVQQGGPGNSEDLAGAPRGLRVRCAEAAMIAAAGAFTSGTRDGRRQASGRGISAA